MPFCKNNFYQHVLHLPNKQHSQIIISSYSAKKHNTKKEFSLNRLLLL